MIRVTGAVMLLLASACSDGNGARQETRKPQDLETAAIERGLVRDPAESEVAGLYARDTDRICVVRSGMEYRVGAFVDYGDRLTCSGAGTLTRAGGTLRIELGPQGGCGFDARFDGDAIRFPGSLPDGCRALCSGRASFAGLEADRLSESAAEAMALRDGAGRRLCEEGSPSPTG